MNSTLPCFFISAAVLTLSLSIESNLRAQTVVFGQSGTTITSSASANSPATTSFLSQAYVALSGADHDYQGHRIRAMRQIEAAAKELGITL